MAYVVQPTHARSRIWILAALAGLALLYVVGLDQGQLLSFVQGSAAFDQNVIHETLHDARHLAGFPCH